MILAAEVSGAWWVVVGVLPVASSIVVLVITQNHDREVRAAEADRHDRLRLEDRADQDRRYWTAERRTVYAHLLAEVERALATFDVMLLNIESTSPTPVPATYTDHEAALAQAVAAVQLVSNEDVRTKAILLRSQVALFHSAVVKQQAIAPPTRDMLSDDHAEVLLAVNAFETAARAELGLVDS